MQNITRMQLHMKHMQMPGTDISVELTEYVIMQLNIIDNTENRHTITKILRDQFIYKYQKRWRDSHRKNSHFLEKNRQWLSELIHFPDELFSRPNSSDSLSGTVIGRPKKEFKDLTERNKRRRTDDILEDISPDLLIYAAARSLQESGNLFAAKIIRMVIQATPTEASKMWKKLNKKEEPQSTASPEEAIAIMMSSNFTRQQYLNIKKLCTMHNHYVFPSDYALRRARKETYPNNIHITDTACTVDLRSLLNHTAKRLLLSSPLNTEETKFCLISKWGMDGSSGHSVYKQGWETSENAQSDESVFMTSMVPLKLIGAFSKKVYWENPRPSSSRFCRPISLNWTRETTELILAEEERIEIEINSLVPYETNNISIVFTMLLTTIDGKVCVIKRN